MFHINYTQRWPSTLCLSDAIKVLKSKRRLRKELERLLETKETPLLLFVSIFQWEDKEESYQRKGRRRKNKTKVKQSYTCSRPTTQGRDLQQFTAALTKEDTSAELDTLGTLSTMACFMYLSMACNIVPCEKRGRKSIDAQPLEAEYKCLDKNKCTTCSKSPQKSTSPNSKSTRETSVSTPEDSVTRSLQQGSLRAGTKTP